MIYKYVVYNARPNAKGLCSFYSTQGPQPITESISTVVSNQCFHFYKFQIRELYNELIYYKMPTNQIVVTPLYQFRNEVHYLTHRS